MDYEQSQKTAYEVTGFDICVQGFERLHSQNEFILCTPVVREDASEKGQVMGELVQDIQCCDRPDTADGEPFDYEEARRVVIRFIETNWEGISKQLAGLEELTDEQREADDWPGCWLFLYISTPTE